MSLTDPSRSFVAITPSDTVDLSDYTNKILTRGIYVGGSGNIVAVDNDGATVTFAGCVAGTVLPIQCRRINSTSTTATNLVALY